MGIVGFQNGTALGSPLQVMLCHDVRVIVVVHERVLKSITHFVEGKLKLKVNRDKSAVDRPWNRRLLGFSFLSNRQATIRLAPKTISRFKEKVRELTNRSRSISMEERSAESQASMKEGAM